MQKSYNKSVFETAVEITINGTSFEAINWYLIIKGKKICDLETRSLRRELKTELFDCKRRDHAGCTCAIANLVTKGLI